MFHYLQYTSQRKAQIRLQAILPHEVSEEQRGHPYTNLELSPDECLIL